MSGQLAKIRLLSIDYDSFNINPNPNGTFAIQAIGPFEPAGNKNTSVTILKDAVDPFKYRIQYQEDRVPEREAFEWAVTDVSPGKLTGPDGKVTFTIVFFGVAEQGEKELRFKMTPGDIVGKHSVIHGAGEDIL